MNRLANDIRTTGTVFGNMIKGSMLSNISLLVPAIASLVPALMAVMNANRCGCWWCSRNGTGIWYCICWCWFICWYGSQCFRHAQKGTLEATAETQRYQSALNSLQSAWEGIIKQNQSQIFNTLANGIDTAKAALQGLTPFISGVSKGMEQASAKMLDWVKTHKLHKVSLK